MLLLTRRNFLRLIQPNMSVCTYSTSTVNLGAHMYAIHAKKVLNLEPVSGIAKVYVGLVEVSGHSFVTDIKLLCMKILRGVNKGLCNIKVKTNNNNANY